jgi:hypothetical protein
MEIADVVSALAAHPLSVGLLAVVLLVSTAVNERTASMGEQQLAQLERERPRVAGLLYLCRGLAPVVHWLLRGVLLVLAPSLAAKVFGAGALPPAAAPGSGDGAS